MLKRALIGCACALALLVAPSVASARRAPGPAETKLAVHFPPPIRPFAVYGVSTREQRSELVSEGYDIGERAYANHVILYGTRPQALLLTMHGYRVVPQTPDDFPPGDSAYHNYAEM